MTMRARVLRRLDTLIDDVQREGYRTERVLGRMPDAFLDFTPSAQLPTAGKVVGHIAAVYLLVARAYRGEDVWNTVSLYLKRPKPSWITTGEALSAARNDAITSARVCPRERMRAIITPYGFPEPAITFLRRAVDHEIHHRGELSVYASMFGVPMDDLYECERRRAKSP
jgi:uncharacterized damage-inducible protein DinB